DLGVGSGQQLAHRVEVPAHLVVDVGDGAVHGLAHVHGKQDGQHGVVAAGHAFPELPHAPRQRLGAVGEQRTHDAEPAVEHDVERLGAHGRHVQRDLVLYRTRLDGHLGKAELGTVVGEGFALPRRGDDVERLPEAVARLGHLHAEAGELARLVTPAPTEVEAPAGDDVESGVVRGHPEGIVERQHAHGRAQPHAVGAAGQGGEEHGRAPERPVVGEVVLGHPRVGQAEGLAVGEQVEQLGVHLARDARRWALEDGERTEGDRSSVRRRLRRLRRLRRHRPTNFGSRFWTKAWMPSRWSSVAMRTVWAMSSSTWPAAMSVSTQALSTALAVARARGALASIRRARSVASSMSWSWGTTLVASPAANASWALMISPPRYSSLARMSPRCLTMREQPPLAGMRPILASGKPILALSDRRRKSAARAISTPSPTATPLTAAITGLSRFSRLGTTSGFLWSWKKSGASPASRNLPSWNFFTSAPAENARPEPVRISTRMASFWRTSSMTAFISARASWVSGLRSSGRLNVRVAMPSSVTSNRKSWSSINAVPPWPWPPPLPTPTAPRCRRPPGPWSAPRRAAWAPSAAPRSRPAGPARPARRWRRWPSRA